MRRPRIPPMLSMLVQTAIAACDGVVFDSRASCPLCGGALAGYDTKQKQFAVLREGDTVRTVRVKVRRFSCRQCSAVCFADEPFYPATRIGSPVVDLCLTLAESMPFSRAATYLDELGIVVDRMTVRNYARRRFPRVATADVFGIRLPLSVISLSSLSTEISEGGCIKGAEALAACGFPSAERAPLQPALPRKERDERDEHERDKERDTRYPEKDREQQ